MFKAFHTTYSRTISNQNLALYQNILVKTSIEIQCTLSEQLYPTALWLLQFRISRSNYCRFTRPKQSLTPNWILSSVKQKLPTRWSIMTHPPFNQFANKSFKFAELSLLATYKQQRTIMISLFPKTPEIHQSTNPPIYQLHPR